MQNNDIFVIKRNGKKEKFDISKIKKQIHFACSGYNVNPFEFESDLHLYIKDGIKTTDIQTALKNLAKTKVTADNPEWNYVAGRIAMWDIYGTVFKNTNIKFSNWRKLVDYLIDNGFYKEEVRNKLDKFNIAEEDINYGNWKNMDLSNPDFNKKISQVLIFLDKYIIKDKNGVIEYPFMIHIANAALLADTREEFFKYYNKLSNNEISLATPFLANLRKPNGNTGSCFIGSNADSLTGLIKAWADISSISRAGGGIGWWLGKVRPSNTFSTKVVKSNPITKWTKIFNDIIIAVNQGGTRKGALTLALPWWHLDIYDFLEAKSPLKGDMRNKTFDIFPQVVVDKYLVERYFKDDYVYLVNQYVIKQKLGIELDELVGDELYNTHLKIEKMIENGELINEKNNISYRKVKAVDIIKKIFWHWVEVGEIYVADIDNLNKSNYLIYDTDPERKLITPCANLCVESFSVVKTPTKWKEEATLDRRKTLETDGMYHACNLTSINLVEMLKPVLIKDYEDRPFEALNACEDRIKDIVYTAVDMLDKSIDWSTFPVKEAENGAYRLRNIGLGYLGLADIMAFFKLSYNSKDGIKFGMTLTEKIAYHAYNASIELAKEKGSYPWFKPTNYQTLFGIKTNKLNEISSKITGNNYDWEEVRQNIINNGIRNFLLLAIAPNTSTGIVMGVSPSYLPIFTKDGTQELANLVVPLLPEFIKERYWYYKTRYQYRPEEIVDFTRAIQTFIDTGISMELNLHTETTEMDKLINRVMEGFYTGELKAVYYNRSSSTCTDCAN